MGIQIPLKPPTRKQPMSGETIIVNPGHGIIKKSGRLDTGAVGHLGRKKILEMDLNDKVALNVRRKLETLGANVIFADNMQLDSILALENSTKPTAFVSIHHNAPPPGITNWHGEQMFAWQPEGVKLAECINKRFKADETISNRGINKTRAEQLKVLKADASIPAILVECGFMSDKNDLKHLNNQDYQNLEAQFIVDGIRDFLQLKKRDGLKDEMKKPIPMPSLLNNLRESNTTNWHEKISNEDI